MSAYQWERENILAEIEGYDPSFRIVHYDSWCSFEENGWMFILQKDGDPQLFALEYSYSVMATDNTPEWNPYPVTLEQAVGLIVEWEAIESCGM